MGKLDGKVALVTGSGRNIGRATVLKLAGEGAHVVVNARSNQAEADDVAREARDLGVRALAVIADVAKKDQVDAMVARAMSEFGRIDILINNAAIRPHKPFTEVTIQDWERVRGVVLDGALYCLAATGSGYVIAVYIQHPRQCGLTRQHRYSSRQSRVVPRACAERRRHSIGSSRARGRDRRHLPLSGQRRRRLHHRPDHPRQRRHWLLLTPTHLLYSDR